MRQQGEHGKPAKVVLVGHLPPPHTGQTVALDILQSHLPEYGFDVEVCDTGGAGTHGRAERDVRSRGLRRIKEISSALVTLPGMLRGSDLLYVTLAQRRAGFLRDLAFIVLGRLARVPVVAHLHGGNYSGFYAQSTRPLRLLVRWLLRRTARIIVLGELLKEQFDFDPALSRKLVTVNNGVPFEGPPSPVEHKDWRHDGPLRVLYLSNMHVSKGYPDLLEACRMLHADGTPFECAFCGQFNDAGGREQFVRAIAGLGLESCVHYRGKVVGQAKRDCLAKSHVMVLPTNYANEGQPISVIEGMAYGLAVITTKYRGLPELVEHGTSGFFVLFGRPRQIAGRLRQLAADRARLKSLCEASHRRYRERFRRKLHVERMVQVFRSVLSEVKEASR